MSGIAYDQVVQALENVGSEQKSARDWTCPVHEDSRASLSVTNGDGKVLLHCQAGCTLASLLDKLSLEPKQLYDEPWTNGHQPPSAIYNYTDEGNNTLYEVLRYEPKGFKQRRPDGNGGWIWKLDKTRRVLYRLPNVISATGQTVYVCEGEKDVEALELAHVVATCNPGGVGKWKADYSKTLAGKDVVVIADKDEPGYKHAATVSSSLGGVAASVRVVEPAAGCKDAYEHLAAGLSVDEFVDLSRNVSRGTESEDADGSTRNVSRGVEPYTLAEVVATYERRLHLVDYGVVYAVLGSVAANLLDGDPVWLIVIGSSSSGKTEVIQPVTELDAIYPTAVFTEGSLLSGTARKEQAEGAKGGLLREIGDFGIILCKDFGSVLNMNGDTRGALLAAMREIYDGSWTRHVGTDGGRSLHWEGKVGFLAGCTQIIDRHHAVMAAMGERFMLFRLSSMDTEKRAKYADEQAKQALDHEEEEKEMRAELKTAVAGLFCNGLPFDPPTLSDDDKKRLVALSTLAVRCRSSVERDGRSREVDLIPDSELPARLVKALAKQYKGIRSLGASDEIAWKVVTKCALDSMPALRLAIVRDLYEHASDGSRETSSIARSIDNPTNTVRRALEDLTAHKIVERIGGGKGQADTWVLTTWARERCETIPVNMATEISGTVTFPEKSAGVDDSDWTF